MSQKITALTALTSPASGDVLPVVDISDTSMAASGTTKKITVATLDARYLQLAGGTMTGALSVAAGATSSALDVEGAAPSGQLAFIKQTSTIDSVHALTCYQAGGTGLTNTVALNVTSDSDSSSAQYISGSATQRGVLKINHTGQAGGSDATASAIAIDLGSVAGTAAQGIALITTTPTTGNLILMRNNGRDDFVVKGAGTVAIGVASGHTPAGMLEIAQKDTSTVGLAMTAIASGTDMINLKDSGGAQRFQIGNAGNATFRASSFFTSPVQVGSASSDFGGGSSCISIKHATDPTTNPTAGGIIYVDSTGHLCYRGSSGTVTQIAVA